MDLTNPIPPAPAQAGRYLATDEVPFSAPYQSFEDVWRATLEITSKLPVPGFQVFYHGGLSWLR